MKTSCAFGRTTRAAIIVALSLLCFACSSPVADVPTTEAASGSTSGSTTGSTTDTTSSSWSYTVTFAAADATTAPSPAALTVASPARTTDSLPAAPARTGYIFAGWWTAENGEGTEFTANTPVTANITVYAKWTSYSYTVSFDLQDATSPVSLSPVAVASPAVSAGTLATPAKTSYYFAGWWTEANGGGTEFTATTPVTADITVYAKWSLIPIYTVTFYDSNGTAVLSTESIAEGEVATIPAPEPTKTDYTFGGWFTDSAYTTVWDFTTKISKATSIYAKWSLIPKYTVSFLDYNGSTILATETIAEGKTATAPDPEPTKTGYTFGGWYADSAYSTAWDSTTKITKTTTVYAKWKALITFHTGDGTGSMDDLYVAKGASLTLPANTFTRDGYTFAAWSTAKDSNATTYADKATITESSGAISLWARWNPTGSTSASELTYTVSGGCVTISAYTGTETAIVIPAWINEYPVTIIADSAFKNNTAITSVTIPETVKSVGNYAFDGCSSLSLITIPSSVTSIGYNAFYGCKNLYSITIPSSVTLIKDETFYGCTSLSSITIPQSVIAIGSRTFQNCTSLSSVTIPSSVTYIGYNAFDGCTSLSSITIPSSVTGIGGYAFKGCTKLSSITIPSSVTSIGIQTFQNCSSLTSITIPSSVTSIGDFAFGGCTSLTSITIPESVTSISQYAFQYCTSLSLITIPASATSIGTGAFAYCTSLTSIEIPSSVTSIGSYSFHGCTNLTSIEIPAFVSSIDESVFADCTNLTSVTITSPVTSIGKYAFESCTNLSSITIPSSVTSIGSFAFYHCTSLTSIEIPSSVTSIGSYAFAGCNKLTSFTIPSSVTSIDSCAFSLDSTVTLVVTVNATTPPTLKDYPFNTSPSLTIKVPAGCVDAYKSSWSAYAKYIE
jgi:uncharacterized repeat protein (TIGR02543 family)